MTAATSFTGRAVVGVDLDGVCADYTAAFRPFAAEYLHKDPADLPDPQVYNLARAGWGFESTADYLACHRLAVEQGLYSTMPLIPGADEAMQELSDAGAHIRIVTHRLIFGGWHQRVVSDTAVWLETSRIPYMSLCFTGLKDSVGSHVFLEDSPANIEDLREHGFKVFVYDQSYNRDVAGPRIDSWEEGIDEVIGYLQEIGQLD